jgi:peptidoglycan glycosyltransferase
MRFTHELNRMIALVLVAFAAVALAATYWAVVGPNTLLTRDDNPRLVEDAIRLKRGAIVDRRGNLLADSTADEQGVVTRTYYAPELASATGYFSFRYGVGGAEAAYDEFLSGATRPMDIGTLLLHQPAIGDDIQLTVDLDVQRAIVTAMGDHQGAVVVLAVPSGDVLALVSLPAFDPNTLDANWDELIQDAGEPFFNRVLQGSYQPGGLLQTPILAAALADSASLDTIVQTAVAPVRIEDVVLQCIGSPQAPALTLAEAYGYTCPAPFAALVNDLEQNTVQAVFDNFALGQPVTLAGFVPEPEDGALTPTPLSPQTEVDFLETALGQGNLTVNPLQMALIAAAIINEGNAPQPAALLAVRVPGTETWIKQQTARPSMPFTTSETATQVQTAMLEAVQNGAAQAANGSGITIGGHVALAYSGEGTQAWFVGFTPPDSGSGVAVAVVIENSDDTDLAARIGGTALASAFAALSAAGN